MTVHVALLCLGAWLAFLPGAARSEDFDRVVNDYLAGYWKANPSSAATPAGIHSHDRQLEDFSAPAIQQEIRRNREFLARLEALESRQLSPDARVDRLILLDRIRLTLLELERIRPWKTQPQSYLSLLEEAVWGLMKRPFAPPDKRFLAVTERLRQVPRLLAQARANLDNPPELYTRKAMELAPGTADLLDKDVSRASVEQGASRRVRAQVRKEGLRAAAALRDFGQWLEKDLLPRSKGSFAQDPEVFGLKFRYLLGTELKPEQVLASAQADCKRTREEMRQLAARLEPGKPVAQALDTLAGNHPRREDLLKVYRDSVAAAKDFVAKTRLARLPQPDRLSVEPAPASYAAREAFLDPPGVFETDLPWFYYVSSLEKLSYEAAEDALRDNNTYRISLAAIQDAYPGHYVQLDAMNRTPWLVRKVFRNPAFVEGWAQYAEQAMFEEGFSGCPTALFHLQGVLRSQLRAVLDILLHTGRINPAEAVKMLMEEGFEERAAAEKEVERAALTPVRPSSYYTGKLEILKLREELEKRLGPAFVLGEFHERLLALGAPPVRLAQELLLEQWSSPSKGPESGR